MSDAADRKELRAKFRRCVNMAPKDLERWLESEDSHAVGYTREGEDEAVGHQSGRRIIDIRRANQADLTDDDYAHMRKVVGYIHRHAKQRPSGDITNTRWRFSLMNWGHDPVRTD